MCEFVSWVEKRGKVYFLTGEQLFNTVRGKKLVETISPDDYCGHGTIRAYYGIDSGDGVDRECTNFSTPDNFLPAIAQAIKAGKMRGMGIGVDLLTKPARAEYDKVCQTARAEYDKVCQPARAEYDKVYQPAFWDLFAIIENRATAWR